jgi:hypothetical protein
LDARNDEQSQKEKAIFDKNWELKLDEMRNAHGDKVDLKKKVEHVRGMFCMGGVCCLGLGVIGHRCVISPPPPPPTHPTCFWMDSGADINFKEAIIKTQKAAYDQMCDGQYAEAEVDRLSAKVRTVAGCPSYAVVLL